MVKTITSLSEFVEEIEKTGQENLIYRGHADVEWLVKPAIGRMSSYSETTERNMLNEFKRKYYSYTDVRVERDMDTLFLAQHYGLPTRLLDWTFNPLIALYFACSKEEKHDGCIYTLEYPPKYLEGEFREEKDDIDPLSSFPYNMIVMPDIIDIRYRNQQGIFEIFANPTAVDKHCQLKFRIPAKRKNGILATLAKVGIEETFVYPDLERLTKSIKKKYNI